MNDEHRQDPGHPELSDEELERQRGEDPPETVGDLPGQSASPDPDPNWQPNPDRPAQWKAMYDEISKEHRPRREDVYPYLLIRAFSPGDRGQRPTWPPTVCWESPDILLIDASWPGEFNSSQLVISPVAGRSYRVFVRVWNLGLLPALGVHVRAWAVNAGFVGNGNQADPYYQAHLIGGRMHDQLEDRTRPGCSALVELDQPWRIEPNEIGHWCLIASVTCPADHFAGPLLVNTDRHVGQRNLSILAGAIQTKQLVFQLGRLVPERFTLEMTHGGPAALPILQALSGGALPAGEKRRGEIVVPAMNEIRPGADIGASFHLLTVFRDDGQTVAVRSDKLAEFVLEARHDQRERVDNGDHRGHPFAAAGGTRRLLEAIGRDRWEGLAMVTNAPLADGLLQALVQMLEIDDLSAGSVARALGGPEGAQHLLRFTLTTPDGDLVGGYSVVVT